MRFKLDFKCNAVKEAELEVTYATHQKLKHASQCHMNELHCLSYLIHFKIIEKCYSNKKS